MQLQGFVNEAALITIANCSEIKCMPSLVPAQYKPQNPHKVNQCANIVGEGLPLIPIKLAEKTWSWELEEMYELLPNSGCQRKMSHSPCPH